jgi:hypothetical protein
MGEGTGSKLKCVLEISFLSRVALAATRRLESIYGTAAASGVSVPIFQFIF